MSEYKTITLDYSEKGIALLRLNRPEAQNTINLEMVDDISAALSNIEKDPDTRILILTGEGEAFCSGTDLKAERAAADTQTPRKPVPNQIHNQRRIIEILIQMRQIPQPIIAAVNGDAVGAGFSFAMASDVRIASLNAHFIPTYIYMGLSGGDIGAGYFLPRLIGLSRASDILLTGRTVFAEEANEIGLVTSLAPRGRAVKLAFETARAMLAKTPLALKMAKISLNHYLDASNLSTAIYTESGTESYSLMTGGIREERPIFHVKPPTS